MNNNLKLLTISGMLIILLFTSLGCIGFEEDFDISDTKVEGECAGKNTRNESVIKITRVENSPKAEHVYALIQDSNGTYLDWDAFGENPGNRHPISAITTISGRWVDENEDITWMDNYEDHLLRSDEEFYISKELVPPDASGYTFILEYKTGKKLLEVEILPIEKEEEKEEEKEPKNGEIEDLKFYIEISDNEIADGEFNVSCSLKNMGNASIKIAEAFLGLPTLDFFIETPEEKTVHYLGPYVLTKANGIELQPGKKYEWNSTIENEHQVWGEESEDYHKASYKFSMGDYKMYGNYTSDPSDCWDNSVITGWRLSNLISFTLE